MDTKTIKALEFHKILDRIANYASSEPARAAVRGFLPLTDLSEITMKLDETEEADKILFLHSINPSFAIDDISDILQKADIMSVLSMGELLKIERFLRVSRSIKTGIAKVSDDSVKLVKAIAAALHTNKQLEDDIALSILSESEMSDHASPDLRAIRVKIKKIGDNIKTKLNGYITSASYSKYIQDNIVTVRNGRYVIPLKAEYKGMIPGLIHDQSASGQTLYVEPMAIVELNNTLREHILAEEVEIERILRALTLRVSIDVPGLSSSMEKVVYLDTVFAKAKYREAVNGVKPLVNDKGIIDVSKGRHPLISPDKVVPIDIKLGKDFDMLFITGPNTGGKTVSLKLTGLFEIMALSGIFVPARHAEISLFDNIFSDIGDEQSIEQSLSTFSSHLSNIIRITEKLTDKTLVLLDELGAGTDPTEGAALAISIASFIKDNGAKAVITTHYNELKEYAVVTDRVENASMDFDPATYNPTYKLIIGTPGVSNAILIAKKLGLNAGIIEKAQAGIEGGKPRFENIMNALETARRKAIENEDKTAELLKEAEIINKNAEREKERLYIQRARLNENVRKETKRLVEEAMSEADEIISSLKTLLDKPTEEALFEARKLRKSLSKFVVNEDNEFEGFGEEDDGAVGEGDTVLVKTLKVEGVVTAINKEKGTATVKLGKLFSNFSLDGLVKLKTKKNDAEQPRIGSKTLNTSGFSPEINLIGQNSMEALTNLEAYMDRAIASGLSEVRIIHGRGTGKLRDTVHKFMKNNKNIKSYRCGNYHEGSLGVTIVTLKQE